MRFGLSFLGKGNYEVATYSFANQKETTSLFPFAFCKFFQIERLYLVMTDESKQKNFNNLKILFENDGNSCEIYEVLIPFGRNELELWNIFNSIANVLPENSEIYFDITHSFRSLPFIAIAICNYLSIVKNINISKVVYGAYDARDGDIAPVFDLTPFLELIRWSNAVNQFIKFGNSKELRNLVGEINNQSYKAQVSYKPKALGSFANHLNEVTTALAVARIEESLKHANKMLEKLDDVVIDIEKISKIQPLKLLLEKIKERFLGFCVKDDNIFSNEGFSAQLKMIEYYLETEQYMQAICLAREIIVSKIAADRNLCPKKRSDRENVEKELNELVKELSEKSNTKNDLAKLWSEITSTRNDIAHLGMNENPLRASRAIVNVRNICLRLRKFIESEIIK
ncbi:MAG: TIGR02221 family CRISPR-associated protein [Ignavibacteria bacterium]|nr:TIGR02221 family CRISPR-associated protein [Ignavibacteria bacterium]